MRTAAIGVLGVLILSWALGEGRPDASGAAQSLPAEGEEFAGPFPSWTNARTAYGAMGDGTADDTAALQRGLTGLDADSRPVLFLPPGTYRLTDTLLLADKQNVRVIGADPERVTLVWDGPPGGTMLLLDGVAYSSISRLTFNGSRRALAAVEQSWDNVGGFFDTGNEYVDDHFIDTDYGIRGGFKNSGFAETRIVRGRFVRNTRAGVALGNFNALDIWIWNSLFDHCRVGVTNDPGAGNFRVYDSIFLGSTLADLAMQNTGLFTARGNYSRGSKAFYVSGRPINYAANIDIQGNVIVDSTDSAAIRLANPGPGLVLDNTVRSLPDASGPVVSWYTTISADVVSIGNTFTIPNPVAVGGRLLTFDDRVVSRASVTPAEPQVPSPLPNLNRPVFEVPPGGDGSTIQDAINAAAKHAGKRPIVHIPFGIHAVQDTIVVPPSDVQILGDGYATLLVWKGSGPGPVMSLRGPTRAALRDMTVRAAKTIDGIVLTNVDQAGSRLRFDSADFRAGEASNLFVNGLDRALVELLDFNHVYSPRASSIRLTGSTSSRSPAARTIVFNGGSAGHGLTYDVSGNVTAVVRDMWYEGETTDGFAKIRDGASFTVQGSRISTPVDRPSPAIAIANAGGRVTLLSLDMTDRIAVTPPGPNAVFVLGLIREFRTSPFFSDTSAPVGRTLIANSRQRVEKQGMLSIGSSQIPTLGALDPTFIRTMLAETRAHVSPSPLRPRPSSATDFRLSRVWVDYGRHNLVIAP